MHALSSTSYSSAGTAAPKCASQRASTRPSTSARATAAPQDMSLSQSGGTPSKARVAILGASGYTGADCVRLCHAHPFIDIVELTGESQAGKAFDEVYPHLAATKIPKLKKVADVDFGDVDAAFCCLPHATTQDILASLPKHVKVVDLSADFRLKDINTYAQWYGGEHKAPELQKEAVYGLTEFFREEIKAARLVANPGCYPTSVQLPLVPLLKAGLISPDDIIIDAKSGVSGAGRSAKQANLYTEVAEGMKAYGVGSHRHMPEIEQGLSEAAGRELKVSFTPHLIPMSRGMMSTMYVRLAEGQTADSLRDHLTEVYAEEPFVQVMAAGKVPDTHYVRGTNFNFVNVFQDRRPGWAVVVSVIDNLVKGASGQALQNLNLVLGFPEGTGLNQLALFP